MEHDTKVTQKDINSQFILLASSVGAQPDLASRWANQLVDRYTETGRYYHTVLHISSMLSLLTTYESLICDITSVKLAIFFHDFIYNPRANDNEIQSVESFKSFAKEVDLSETKKANVIDLIEGTIKHLLNQNEEDEDRKADMRLFLDFDLEVLSRDPSKYAQYAAQIRKEYGHYSEKDYCTGRIGVLESFLMRERLYFSDDFYQACEAKARSNIKAEILDLQGRLAALSDGD